MRNLPKRSFYEDELRELMITVMDAYKVKNTGITTASKKLLRQVKVMRDQEKEAKATEEGAENLKLASGLAFVELMSADVALFTVRYLNNMQLTGRGLIVDFCLEDARKMHHRK